MGLSNLLKRLSYPHKKTAWKYFIDDPRLVFGIPRTPAKSHVASVIERLTGENIVLALHNFLPEQFRKHLEETGRIDDLGYRLLLYMLVRQHRPDIVVETGVSRGLSSAYILCAMQENGKGKLYSIDLPPQVAATTRQEDQPIAYILSDGQTHQNYEVGYLVPEYLKDRWNLILEDAREALPRVMEETGTIDFFYHDSLHTYDHMKFEFETAWPHLREGGLLLSDDVLWSNAFHEICKRERRKPIIYRSFGVITK